MKCVTGRRRGLVSFIVTCLTELATYVAIYICRWLRNLTHKSKFCQCTVQWNINFRCSIFKFKSTFDDFSTEMAFELSWEYYFWDESSNCIGGTRWFCMQVKMYFFLYYCRACSVSESQICLPNIWLLQIGMSWAPSSNDSSLVCWFDECLTKHTLFRCTPVELLM